MPEPMGFRIGAIQLGLSPDTNRGTYTRMGRFADFYASTPADVTLHAICGKTPIISRRNLVFESNQSWRMYRDGTKWILHIRSSNQDPYQCGLFEGDFRNGDIYVSKSNEVPEGYVFPLAYPLGELFATNLLGTGLGVMLHACGVVDRGNGMIFAGISTAGKTTTARLWMNQPGVQVLNDDHNIVRKMDSQFRLFGTPWHGQGGMALPLDAPLKRIFILKHAPFNQVIPLTVPQALTALVVRSFSPLWSKDGMRFTLQFLEELCQALPCYELGFVPDSSVVDFIRCLPDL